MSLFGKNGNSENEASSSKESQKVKEKLKEKLKDKDRCQKKESPKTDNSIDKLAEIMSHGFNELKTLFSKTSKPGFIYGSNGGYPN